MVSGKVMGRVWFFDTGDPCDIEVWQCELEPMQLGLRNVAEWAREHFCESYDEADLRELLSVPAKGGEGGGGGVRVPVGGVGSP